MYSFSLEVSLILKGQIGSLPVKSGELEGLFWTEIHATKDLNFMLVKTNQKDHASLTPSTHCKLDLVQDFQDSALPDPIHDKLTLGIKR